jgi:hypothetical protein
MKRQWTFWLVLGFGCLSLSYATGYLVAWKRCHAWSEVLK